MDEWKEQQRNLQTQDVIRNTAAPNPYAPEAGQGMLVYLDDDDGSDSEKEEEGTEANLIGELEANVGG